MICWLASYPRSGNTLLRIVLRQCFDIWSYGAVGEGDDASFDEIAGHLSYEGERAAFLKGRRRWPGMHFVKTHIDMPAIEDRAIYVVRDGRAAIASYQRFLRDFDGEDFALPQIICGWPIAMTWTDHIKRWLDRPNVLLLRYEDLTSPKGPPLEAISRFIGRPVLKPFEMTFEQLQSSRPDFFRVGSNRPGIKLVERSCSELFWSINGEMMRHLGYGLTDR
jgi:hypothetical protein